MADGSTQVSANLTPETAALLARLHPNMFPTVPTSLDGGGNVVDGEKLTQLVQSVLLNTSKYSYTLRMQLLICTLMKSRNYRLNWNGNSANFFSFFVIAKVFEE